MVLPATPPRQHPPPAIATAPVINGKVGNVSGGTESTFVTVVFMVKGNTVAAMFGVEIGMAVVGIDATGDGVTVDVGAGVG